jgi:hypothetical protein
MVNTSRFNQRIVVGLLGRHVERRRSLEPLNGLCYQLRGAKSIFSYGRGELGEGTGCGGHGG